MKERPAVLILEDDASFGALEVQAVRQAGAEGVLVRSNEAFREALCNVEPAAVVLDIVLQDEDVCAAIDALAARRCAAPVFLMSGYDYRMRKFIGTVARDRGLHVADILDKAGGLPRLRQQLQAHLVSPEPRSAS